MKPDPLSFKASWLALREPHDHAARDDGLTRRLCRYLRSRSPFGAPDAPGAALPDPSPGATSLPIRVLDLGCGTGSSLRYLAPRIQGSQHWKMVDRDPELLALLPAVWRSAVRIEPVCLDLAGDLRELPLAGIDLITASALLDLVSSDWVDRLLDATNAAGSLDSTAAGPALLLALSYDGSVNWQPVLPDDCLATALFNRHQRGDKGFGPALGPAAAVEAARRLEGRGFSVTLAPSPWRLGVEDSAIQRELLAGIAGAAAACAGSEAEAARVRSWSAARDALLAEGRSVVEVGHQDLLAQPSPE